MLCSFQAYGVAKGDSRIKYELEAGLKIHSQAAQRILAQYPFEVQVRNDYYVDIYDGRNFLLIPSPQLYRFRLKSSESKAVLQINTKKSVTKAGCSNGETFRVEEKEVGELRLEQDKAKELTGLIDKQLYLMTEQSLTPVAQTIHDLHREIGVLRIPLKEKILNAAGEGPWFFTASHTSSKLKHKLMRDMGWGNIEISVTVGQDYVGTRMIQERSEIEFQPDQKMSSNHFVTSICRFLGELHLSDADRDSEIQNPQDMTLSLLKKFNGELGLPD